MERYLLFDAGCAVCNQLADAIEEAGAGKLQALSIHDPQAREWLEQAYPAGWAHQPYLVVVDGERVRAYAGTGMALRLGWLLGPRKAWRVWNLARQYEVSWPAGEGFSAERRGFLKRAALFVGSLLFFPRFGSDDTHIRPEGHGDLIVQELRGKALEKAVQGALDHEDGQIIEQFLAARDYQAQIKDSTGMRVVIKGDGRPGIMVSIPFRNGDELAKMIFVSGGDTVKAGAGLMEMSDGAVVAIDVYEVRNGSTHYEGRLERRADGTIIIRSADGQSIPVLSGRVTIQDACDNCKDLCNIVLGISCGLGGILACELGCIVFAGTFCTLWCPAIYVIHCVIAPLLTCDDICISLELCPPS